MDRYRVTEDFGLYFVTFTIIKWLPLFNYVAPTKILIDSLKYCIQNKNLRINAYVIMPNHFHGIVFDANLNHDNLNRTLTNFRKFTGRQIADYVDANLPRAYSSVLRGENLHDRERRLWQSGWHSEGIYSENFWQQKVDYIHENPCRKGLVEDPQEWRYSSASFWMEGKSVDLPIADLDWL